MQLLVYHGSKRQDTANGLGDFDVVLTTYDTLRTDWASRGPLYSYTWARVVLDEAHKIRNAFSQTFYAACDIRTHNRWCLTGTPIQNSLDDFGSLLAFIGVPPFLTREQFRFWVTSPVLSSQAHSLNTLRKLVRATCLRRTKALPHLASSLGFPSKTERIETVELAPHERELYDFFKRRSFLLTDGINNPKADAVAPKKARGRRSRTVQTPSGPSEAVTPRKRTANIMVLISVLRMICDHGEALLPKVALEAWQNRDPGVVSWTSLQEMTLTELETPPLPAETSGPSSKVTALMSNLLKSLDIQDPTDDKLCSGSPVKLYVT